MARNIGFIFLFFLILLFMSVFTVKETEKAARFQFNKMLDWDYKPGLHFKMPFPINTVRKYDARILTLDMNPERFLTSEKKNVIVDTVVKWRIADVKIFHTAVTGSPEQANKRLDQIMKDALRSEFSKRSIRDLVSSDRQEIQKLLIADSQPVADALGINVVDVRIKRIDLPPDVSNSVYRRMEAERTRVAKEFRSQGAEQAEGIRADADKQREIIVANAYREAEMLRGDGDAVSADTYAKAYGKNEEFFNFYRSLMAYQRVFRKPGDRIILEPDSEFFRYFKQQK